MRCLLCPVLMGASAGCRNKVQSLENNLNQLLSPENKNRPKNNLSQALQCWRGFGQCLPLLLSLTWGMCRNTVGWECAALGIKSSLQPLLCHWAAAVTSSEHSPSPARLTAQGAGLPGHLLLPADQWLSKGCPISLCPMTCILGSQRSQSWGVPVVQEAREALQAAPQPSKHPGLKMLGLPLCLSSQLFSEGV